MKKTADQVPRQIFVFTAEEKKAVACVLGALILGLATKYYRDTHPVGSPRLAPKQQYAAQRAAKATSARARSASARRATTTATPAPAVDEED